eukprot:357613-Chlamydomonas_euryale.AAC.3
MRQLLRSRGLGVVRVGTVDDYQGQEARVVFISTVLSSVESLPKPPPTTPLQQRRAAGSPLRKDGGGGDNGDVDARGASAAFSSAASLGFWSNPKRFNVAITRCRALLVVVGHPVVLLADACWRQLLAHCARRGAVRGAGARLVESLMTPSAETDPLGGGGSDDGSGEWGSDGDDEDGGEGEGDDDDNDDELRAAAEQLAEMALLGAGDSASMFPQTLEDYEVAMAEEAPSRIAL